MAYNWKYIENGIGIVIEERVIRIANDWVLEAYLGRDKHKACLLAARLREMYRTSKGRDLNITDKSLAAEIYYHYRLQKISLAIEKKHGRSRPTRWMIRHMKVIDCGEMQVDNNRFVWDIASRFWKKIPES